ncbi:protein scylla-like [Homalodisca vitripennis]|uniref:Uncharacterized protein n=1 Tax=Homalodisca liturata TaxID=320908 RepID=A0A1B6JJY0_9HEMI|nr:protein scylla-like [Homalodisca vitripennis]KAG8315130.1 negative regulation of signal transduction [Homalodisca vitripennis]
MIAVEKLPYTTTIDLHRSIMGGEDTDYGVACQALARRLGEELRAAKSAQLSCGEVLLPVNLLPKVANDILTHSGQEPCGLRGCTLDINLEVDGSLIRIAHIKWDTTTSSTFQLNLTFQQDTQRKWTSRISHFLKTLTTKGRTIVISDQFSLKKTRLYRFLNC